MTTAERILAAIAGASSRQPRAAAAVRDALGDVSAAQFAAAIAQLTAERRLYSCSVTRGGTTDLLIWPTDAPARTTNWTSASHSGLFAPRTPRRFPQAPQPQAVVPAPVIQKPAPKGASMDTPTFQMRMDAIRKHAAGHPEADPVTLADIGRALGFASNQTSVMLMKPLERLIEAGAVCAAKRPTDGSNRAKWLVWDATTQPATPSAAVPTPAPLPDTADIALGNDARLCLWDDATLVIESGGRRITVPAVTTRKITRFLVALEGVAQ